MDFLFKYNNSASSATLTGGTGPSKRPFVNPTLSRFGIVLLSFWVPGVRMIWGHTQEFY